MLTEKKLFLSLSRLPVRVPDILIVLSVGSCVLSLIVMGIRVASWPMSFDECLHAHNLWLTSTGLVPHQDFWCNYPATGYALFKPFFRLLPESIYSVMVLRLADIGIFSVMAVVLAFHARRMQSHWTWGTLPLLLVMTPLVAPWVIEFRTDDLAGLAAILAIVQMLREPVFLRTVSIFLFSALSLIIMPKYLYPLALADLVFIGYGLFRAKSRGAFIGAVLAGGAAGIAIVQMLLLTLHLSLWIDLKWSALFMQNFQLHNLNSGLPPLTHRLAQYFSSCWWIGLMLAAGIAGWLTVAIKEKGIQLYIGGAVIGGTFIYWLTCRIPGYQYMIPGLCSLVVFMPYAPRLLKNSAAKAAGTILLAALTIVLKVGEIPRATGELATGAALNDFTCRQSFLDMIPRSERIVGLYLTHPCFRRDQTFVTYDERWGNPKGFLPIIPENSPIRQYFQPGNLAESMEISPPAAIAFDSSGNYPSGWNQVLYDFLMRHKDLYVKGNICGQSEYMRKDLVK